MASRRRFAAARSRFVALLLALLVGSSAGHARAFCRMTTDMPTPGDTCVTTGTPLSWRRSCISFSVAARRPAEPAFDRVRDVADASFATWLDVHCGGAAIGLDVRQTLQLGECAEPEFDPSGPNANTIVFVEDWAERELPLNAFGLTIVWHNPQDGEIFDADMQINETLGALTICDGVCPSRRVDLQNVITHEAGHFLGLGHSAVAEAAMSADARVGEISKRFLHDDDRQGLCAIYGENPRATCESADFLPDNGFAAACASDVDPNSGARCSTAGAAAAGSRGVAGGALGWAAAALVLALAVRRRRLSVPGRARG